MIEEADHRMLRPHALQPHPPRSFFRRDPVWVARKLLGHRLVSGVGGTRTAGIIVETEAYLGIADKAAHTYEGRRSRRNRTMWGAAGHAYVYFVYGMHHCINVVAGETGDPVAVLIRALEPDAGIDTMFERRRRARRATDLCSGPAKLCQALGIDLGFAGDHSHRQLVPAHLQTVYADGSAGLGCVHRDVDSQGAFSQAGTGRQNNHVRPVHPA